MLVTVDIYDIEGKKKEVMKIPVVSYTITPDEYSFILRTYHLNLKQGTVKTKRRGEVSFSKRKPWRQKGTGRARAGTRGSPIWVGGGVAHGPQPYKPYLKRNKRQARRVFAYVISELLQRQRVYGVAWPEDKILKTSQAKDFLKVLGLLPFKVFFVASVTEENIAKSFRNLPKVVVKRAELLNTFDLVSNPNIVATKSALEVLKSRVQKYA